MEWKWGQHVATSECGCDEYYVRKTQISLTSEQRQKHKKWQVEWASRQERTSNEQEAANTLAT